MESPSIPGLEKPLQGLFPCPLAGLCYEWEELDVFGGSAQAIEPGGLGSNPSPASYWLCDLGHVT